MDGCFVPQWSNVVEGIGEEWGFSLALSLKSPSRVQYGSRTEAGFPTLSGPIATKRVASHAFIKQQHCVSTLRTGGDNNDRCDHATQAEIVLKMLKPSSAVLMTAPGI